MLLLMAGGQLGPKSVASLWFQDLGGTFMYILSSLICSDRGHLISSMEPVFFVYVFNSHNEVRAR